MFTCVHLEEVHSATFSSRNFITKLAPARPPRPRNFVSRRGSFTRFTRTLPVCIGSYQHQPIPTSLHSTTTMIIPLPCYLLFLFLHAHHTSCHLLHSSPFDRGFDRPRSTPTGVTPSTPPPLTVWINRTHKVILCRGKVVVKAFKCTSASILSARQHNKNALVCQKTTAAFLLSVLRAPMRRCNFACL